MTSYPDSGDPLVTALQRLLLREGGHDTVGLEAGIGSDNLYQVANCRTDSKTGKAKSVGPGVRRALSARYPDWLNTEPATVSFAHQAVPAAGYVRLPVLAQAAAGPGRVAPHGFDELVEHVDVAEDWVRRTLRANPATLRVLTAKGHSMTGAIEDGDVMFVEPCLTFDRDGLYVIGIDDLLRVKRLRLRVLDRLLSIESNDGSAPETASLDDVGTRVVIHGRVVATWSLRQL